MTDDLAALRQRLSRALSRLVDSDGEARAIAGRDAAGIIVAARELLITRSGDPDWPGRSHAYREWVREAYDGAHIDPAAVPAVQAAVRYHVGNALRERLTAEQLEAAGLRTLAPRERSAETRADRSRRLGLLGGGPAIRTYAEIDEVFETVLRTLERMKQGPAALTDDELRWSTSRLEWIETAAKARRFEFQAAARERGVAL